jgi:hypothetical protein
MVSPTTSYQTLCVLNKDIISLKGVYEQANENMFNDESLHERR